MGFSTLPPFSPFAIDIPPYTVYWSDGAMSGPGPGSVKAYNDSTVTAAVNTLVSKLASFAGTPGTGPLAESIARDLAVVIRNLSSLGA